MGQQTGIVASYEGTEAPIRTGAMENLVVKSGPSVSGWPPRESWVTGTHVGKTIIEILADTAKG